MLSFSGLLAVTAEQAVQTRNEKNSRNQIWIIGFK